MTGLLMGPRLTASAHDDHTHYPSHEQIEFAADTSDLLFATLLAALQQEFDETTVDNVEEGKQSISLVFNDQNKDMRLVGTFRPLQDNNRPRDTFERTAHKLALRGQTYIDVQRVDGQWRSASRPRWDQCRRATRGRAMVLPPFHSPAAATASCQGRRRQRHDPVRSYISHRLSRQNVLPL
jgi:hypothetical protein